MRAQELRIGNYIDTPAGVKRVVSIVSERSEGVYEIRTATRAVSGEENLFMEYEVFPIPLTEELLLNNCGYKKQGDYGKSEYYYAGLVDLSLDFYPTTSDRSYASVSIDGAKEIKYLHELQNLIFALTGEELDVNLD